VTYFGPIQMTDVAGEYHLVVPVTPLARIFQRRSTTTTVLLSLLEPINLSWKGTIGHKTGML